MGFPDDYSIPDIVAMHNQYTAANIQYPAKSTIQSQEIAMIHHLNALSVTEKLRESLQDSGDDFRFAALESNLAEYANNATSWHWHDFVEFAWVSEGTLESSTPMRALRLSAGQGYFVNANVLHTQRMIGEAATIRIIQFVPALLAGSGSIYQKYIGPLEKCVSLEMLPLAAMGVTDALEEVFSLAGEEPDGYELRIMERLFRVWMRLYEAAKPLCTDSAPIDTHADRVKAMLGFIHANYSEPLTVGQIAAFAHISQREAFRCFQQVLGTTPTLYLLHHRINNAARMLVETDLSVTDISMACGFSSPGYMWKVFRDINGVSPRAFRKSGRP